MVQNENEFKSKTATGNAALEELSSQREVALAKITNEMIEVAEILNLSNREFKLAIEQRTSLSPVLISNQRKKNDLTYLKGELEHVYNFSFTPNSVYYCGFGSILDIEKKCSLINVEQTVLLFAQEIERLDDSISSVSAQIRFWQERLLTLRSDFSRLQTMFQDLQQKRKSTIEYYNNQKVAISIQTASQEEGFNGSMQQVQIFTEANLRATCTRPGGINRCSCNSECSGSCTGNNSSFNNN